jgi:hypothetical protein
MILARLSSWAIKFIEAVIDVGMDKGTGQVVLRMMRSTPWQRLPKSMILGRKTRENWVPGINYLRWKNE